MREQQEHLKELLKMRVRITFEIENLRASLRQACDHSETEPYMWEHDNGYGRQTLVIGKRCVYCLFVDLWDRNNFHASDWIKD